MIDKRRTTIKSIILIFIILFSKTAINNKNSFMQCISNRAIKIKYCITNFTHGIGQYCKYYYYNVKEMPYYLKKNMELKNHLNHYKSLENELKACKIENEKLKSLLNLNITCPYKFSTTKLLLLEKNNYSCSAIILSSKGIKRNQLVTGEKKSIVGKVSSITKEYAKIILPCDTQFRISCKTQSDEPCIVAGQGKGELLLVTYANEEGAKKSKIGDIIFSCTDQTNSITGIPIATVEKIKDDKAFAQLIHPVKSNTIVHVISDINR